AQMARGSGSVRRFMLHPSPDGCAASSPGPMNTNRNRYLQELGLWVGGSMLCIAPGMGGESYASLGLQRRQIQFLFPRAGDRFVIARIRMAHDARPRIVPQYARDALARRFAAIAHDHHAGVVRIAHADAAAMV